MGGQCTPLILYNLFWFVVYVFFRSIGRTIHALRDANAMVQESEGGASETDFVSCVGKWRQAGAALVGGCCRTSPATVRAISWALRESDDAVGGDGDRDDFPAVAVL